MKALTVQQPWAWAIVHGGKVIENRTQNWKYRGPLAIHAGNRVSERGLEDQRVIDAYREHQVGRVHQPRFSPWVYGAILGTVELVDVHPDAGCCKPWGESAYIEHGGRERRRIVHLVLENAAELAEPIPCTGALGLWTPPPDVISQLSERR